MHVANCNNDNNTARVLSTYMCEPVGDSESATYYVEAEGIDCGSIYAYTDSQCTQQRQSVATACNDTAILACTQDPPPAPAPKTSDTTTYVTAAFAAVVILGICIIGARANYVKQGGFNPLQQDI